MSNALQRFFYALDNRSHLLIALVLGFCFRLASSWFAYGAQALDDYRHGLLPAYQAWAGLESTLPNYRSPLLTWCLKSILDIGSYLSITQPVEQARLICFCLGVFSLLSVFAAYRLTRNSRIPLLAPLSMYLIALHGLMPFASTRAFGESIAITLVLLGFSFIIGAPKRTQWGLFLIGIATLFRFQVGLIFIGVLIVLLARREFKTLALGLITGLVIASLQAGIDLLAHRGPLDTLINYFNVNKSGAAEYGVQPWYTPILMLLALSFFPFSIPIFRKFKDFLKDNYVSFLPFVLFVGVHCAIPHKEERFMYPVMGLTLMYMAYLWANSWNQTFSRWLLTPTFLVLNSAVLAVACFNNTQGSEIEPIAAIEGRFSKVKILDIESILGRSWVKEYYIRPPHSISSVGLEQLLDRQYMTQLLDDFSAILIVTSNKKYLNSLSQIDSTLIGHCEPTRTAGSLSDRIVYKMNPKRNMRRRPSWFKICKKESV